MNSPSPELPNPLTQTSESPAHLTAKQSPQNQSEQPQTHQAKPSFWQRIQRSLRRGGAHSSHQPTPQPDWLIIGLGNPGEKYRTTRHNAGILAVEQEPLCWQFSKSAHADIARSYLGSHNIAYIRSHYYMNESGKTLRQIQQQWNLPASNIIVVHDELDLPVGKVRIRQGGSHNGHNGLKSIEAALGTANYIRVRIGIGRPATGISVVDHVLGQIDNSPAMQHGLDLGHQSILKLPMEGLAHTQNLIHPQ
ncbi:MAG: aminoacyl-tRNA hydrolase [Corynebacterium sp.]|nr:aminoacyl-tRNA hydrolase [Corynebacterium sp.]